MIVDVPQGVTLNEVTVRLNNLDVTDLFATDGNGSLIGLIEGLAIGKNKLQAKAKGTGTATLQIVNHPLEGPVFSGPHEQPFFCQTETFEIYPGGETLGPALDENCSVLRRVDYVYRSTDGQFKGLDLTGDLPDDLALTTTTEGVDVPYIVRLETGVINRAIYQTAILDDPRFARTKPAGLGWGVERQVSLQLWRRLSRGLVCAGGHHRRCS